MGNYLHISKQIKDTQSNIKSLEYKYKQESITYSNYELKKTEYGEKLINLYLELAQISQETGNGQG